MGERMDEDYAFERQRAIDQTPLPEDPFGHYEICEECPDRGAEIVCAPGGGVVCSKKCGWWFCY